ncbi:tetratricopeptide repeat protein [Thermodesulfobacteriota bacterium]
MPQRTCCKNLLLMGFLAIWVLFSQEVLAINRANDVKIDAQEGRVRLALLLDHAPQYTLESISGRRIQLELRDTRKAAIIERKTAAKDSRVTAKEDKGSLKIQIGLSETFKEIKTSWLAEKNIFYLEILSETGRSIRENSDPKAIRLKYVKFGYEGEGARMVAALAKETLWRMNYQNENKITIDLAALSRNLKNKRYGPIRGLKEVLLEQKNDHTYLHCRLEAFLAHTRIFWLRPDNFLIMDFFKQPQKLIDQNFLQFAAKDNRQSIQQIPISAPQENNLAEIEPILSIPEDLPEDDLPEEALPAKGYIVRKKIPKREVMEPAGTEEEIHKKQNLKGQKPYFVEPQLDDLLPETAEENISLDSLSPEVAYQYGRIREAREIKDYEKGIHLIDRFLNQIAHSPLHEQITFWRGDFYYHLWKRGNNDALPKIVQSYEMAIDLFDQSERIPGTYIKLAQANSAMGNNFDALGNLSMVITIYKNSSFRPLAILNRGKIYLRIEQPQKAIAEFKALIEKYPRSPYLEEANFWVAHYFHSVGMYEEAEKRLKVIAENDPEFHIKYPDFLFLVARNDLYLKNYGRARDYFFQALNMGHQPETPDLLLSRIGDTYHHQSKTKAATKFYRMVTDYYPKSEGATISKIRLADYSADVAMFEDISKENMDKPIGDLALLGKAKKFFRTGQFLDAMATLEPMAKKPIRTETREEAKQLYYRAAEQEISQLFKAGKFKQLTDFYVSTKQSMELHVDSEPMFEVAQSFYRLEQHQEAIATFLELNPYDLEPGFRGEYILSLARSHLKLGNLNDAIALLEKNKRGRFAIADRQRMIMLLADIHRQEDEPKKAYRLYQSLLKGKRQLSDMEIARVYYFMGFISSADNDHERAREFLNRSIALSEKDRVNKELRQFAFRELGNSYHSEGKPWPAIKAYQKCFELGYDPDQKYYWETKFRMALSYLAVGENMRAEPLLTEILSEGDAVLQQKVQVKLGTLGLNRQLERLSSVGSKSD